MTNLFTILAPAFYPTWWPVRYLQESAAACRVPVRFYGLGEPYKDWFDVQVTRLITEIENVTTSHVLYTDASDAILLCSMEEIKQKDRDLDEPNLLLSLEADGVCAGGWLAYKDIALACLYEIRDQDNPSTNPQLRWRQAIQDGTIDFEDMIDVDSLIFQVTGRDGLDVVEKDGSKRIFNSFTENYPAILHFAGGYTSPSVGKAALIETVWKSLGYEGTVDEYRVND